MADRRRQQANSVVGWNKFAKAEAENYGKPPPKQAPPKQGKAPSNQGQALSDAALASINRVLTPHERAQATGQKPPASTKMPGNKAADPAPKSQPPNLMDDLSTPGNDVTSVTPAALSSNGASHNGASYTGSTANGTASQKSSAWVKQPPVPKASAWNKGPPASTSPANTSAASTSAWSKGPPPKNSAWSKVVPEASTGTKENNALPPHLRLKDLKKADAGPTKSDLSNSVNKFLDNVPTPRVSTPPAIDQSLMAAQYKSAFVAPKAAPKAAPNAAPKAAPKAAPAQVPVNPRQDRVRYPGEVVRSSAPTSRTSSSAPMNAGTAAKSANVAASFPCLYADCGMGFKDEKALKDHKFYEHDGYCKLCDIDTEDEQSLLLHKMSSLKHITCQFCGKDFRSEAGRDRHEKLVSTQNRHSGSLLIIVQAHAPTMDVKCIGCGTLFSRGSGLINHILSNQCPDPRGQIRESKLRENRVKAAIYAHQVAHEPFFNDNESEAASCSDDESDDSGVKLSLMDAGVSESDLQSEHSRGLDQEEEEEDLMDMASTIADNPDGSDAGSATTERGSPRSSMALRSGKQNGSIIQGLDKMKVSQGKTTAPPATGPWATGPWAKGAKALFPDAKPTPAPADYKPPSPDPFRNNRRQFSKEYQVSVPRGNRLRSDWDGYEFERDLSGGDWKCPFAGCPYVPTSPLLS